VERHRSSHKAQVCFADDGADSLSAVRRGVSTDSIARPGAAHLEQLTWSSIECGPQPRSLSDSNLLRKLTKLTALSLQGINAAEALEHLGLLTRLQDLSLSVWDNWAKVGCRGLQELKALTRFDAVNFDIDISPNASISQLTALQQLDILTTTPTTLNALQHLELFSCKVSAAYGAADPVSWQQFFPGPGRLPHLTSLGLTCAAPYLRQADMECVVACCSNLQMLHLKDLPDCFTPALTRLSGLTSLTLERAWDWQCKSLAQLTGLRELRVYDADWISSAGLRQLAVLEQLTSLGLYGPGRSSAVLREHMSDRLQGPFTVMYAIINQVCVCACLGECAYWAVIIGTQLAVVVGCRAGPSLGPGRPCAGRCDTCINTTQS